ncbi:MAG: response regulator transcription factor [Deltaproteobacteria bacterium]|nr:response regulator transcription factor [Deltaproteobacteria bacterium]
MAKGKVLVVDDEEDILELLRFTLGREGYSVRETSTGEEALDICKSDPPDLVVLDLMLPGIDGLEVAKRLKNDSITRDIYIVMLSAKGEEADIVSGLEIGADNYVTKPFSPRVLLARMKALLRSGTNEISHEISAMSRSRGLSINPGRHEVRVNGKPIDLTYSEFAILNLLARRSGWVFTRLQILNAIRGEDYTATTRSVDTQIVGLRKKLGPVGKCIETVRGVGYRFRE